MEPNANIGITCGAPSEGLCVLDVDNHGINGMETLRAWLNENGKVLPETATVKTGGGGVHYYFKSEEIISTRSGLMPGIDVKAEGGYIVAPPSVHASRTPYVWVDGCSLADIPIAQVDETVRELVTYRPAKESTPRKKARRGKVHEGERNDALASYLGSLRYKGASQDELGEAALAYNEKKLLPPLDEREVLGVARSISLYPAHYETSLPNESLVDGAVLAKLAELRPEDESRFKNTEQGWGYLFAEVFKDEARYCPERKAWFVFDGTRWKRDDSSLMVGERAKKLSDALHVHLLRLPDNARNQFYDGWRKWQKHSVRETILKDAASVYPVSIAEFDTDPYLLNVLNGTLDLKACELRPHSADDLITKIAPVAYDPEAAFPRWDSFIGEVMDGDEDTALFLQRCLGYALSGSTEHEKMFIFHGATSRNGKSTLTETMVGLLGDYAATADPEMFGTGRNTGGGMKPTEDLARLDGVRFLSIPEPSKGMRLNSASVKQWTGSDTVKARFLHENSFEYKPQFKPFLNTNDLPIATDTALFKSGRIVAIPFTRHFTAKEQDPTLKQKFLEDGAKSAILNWLLAGWRNLQEGGLAIPASVVSATNEYAEESDVIKRFASERLEEDAYGEVRTQDLLKAFNEWALANGLEPSNTNSFKGELLRSGFVVKKVRPRSGGNPASLLRGYKLKNPSNLLQP